MSLSDNFWGKTVEDHGEAPKHTKAIQNPMFQQPQSDMQMFRSLHSKAKAKAKQASLGLWGEAFGVLWGACQNWVMISSMLKKSQHLWHILAHMRAICVKLTEMLSWCVIKTQKHWVFDTAHGLFEQKKCIEMQDLNSLNTRFFHLKRMVEHCTTSGARI